MFFVAVLVGRRGCSALRGKRTVALGSAVAKELPHFADFGDHLEVEVGDNDFVFIAACLRDNFAARIAEVTLPVKLSDAPRLFGSHTIDRTDKVAVRNSVNRLLEFPQILRESGNSRRRIEYDLRAIQAEDSRAFREVTVIANINADSRVLCFKHWIAEIAGCEIKLLPKSGMTMRNVVLAIFAKIPAVGVDYRSCIEIHARHLFFVDGNHNHHAMFRGDFLHQLSRRPVGHALREFVPTCVLLRTKIRPVEKFLQAKDLCLFLAACSISLRCLSIIAFLICASGRSVLTALLAWIKAQRTLRGMGTSR